MKLSEAEKARRDRERIEIGERIREARKQRGLKTIKLAEMVNASANHISMIESGKRAPSKELLKSIAECMGVSYSWLKNGSQTQNNTPTPAVQINPDPQLLLMLLRREHPELFPHTVQAILNVTPDTLEKIMDGSAEYEPLWRHALCSLAQRMDLKAARTALQNFLMFLEEMRLPSELQRIRTALKQYLEKSGCSGYKLQDEQTYTGCYELHNGISMDLHTITFAEKTGALWQFKYVDVGSFPSENQWTGDDIEWDEMMEDIKNRIYGTIQMQINYMQETGVGRISLVFYSSQWYDFFCKCADEQEDLCDDTKAISFILIDEERGEVLKDMAL